MIPPPAIEERLRAHVEEILRRTHVPVADRDDVAEELYGHLVERWTEAVADGADAGDAARDAIRDFGSAERIGGDLTRTYRGRLFASTIGPLLPAKAPFTSRPSIGRWALAWNVGLLSILAGGDALYRLTTLTPIHAVVTGLAWAVAAGILAVICLALLRSQRWAIVVGPASSRRARSTVPPRSPATRPSSRATGSWRPSSSASPGSIAGPCGRRRPAGGVRRG